MATSQTLYSQCDCGTFNASDAALCSHCGATLPWHDPFSMPQTAGAATTADAAYWQKAFGLRAGARTVPTSQRATRFCSACGSQLRGGANFCTNCRHKVRGLNGTDARVGLVVGVVLSGGFLLGVVWSSFLMNYLHPTAPMSTHATAQARAAQQKSPSAAPPKTSDDPYANQR